MSQFDNVHEANVLEQDRFNLIEEHITFLTSELNNVRLQQPQPPSSSPALIRAPNLKLPQPPFFTGISSELPTFKLKLGQFLMGNPSTYSDSPSQLLFAGALLTGSAGKWYAALVDKSTFRLPPHYTLASFFHALDDYFGGAVTLDSWERELDGLRQTGTVSELAISFQNITMNFDPNWPDHPLIYLFSRKMKESIRFQLTSQGSIPPTFQAYVAAAISVENNLLAATLSRSHTQQPHPATPRSTPPPRLPSFPPPRPTPPPPGDDPMHIDGSRGPRGPLTFEERRRRSDAGLCAYCGGAGHVIATCPKAASSRQARGTFSPLSTLPALPAGYPFPPAGYSPPSSFPGPWNLLANPHAAAAAAAVAAAAAADLSKNLNPSQ